MLSLCMGQSTRLWLPACPTSQPPCQLSRNKVSLAETRACAGIWQESNTSSPTAFQAQPACVLGDPHLTTQCLRLLQLPMALPHHVCGISLTASPHLSKQSTHQHASNPFAQIQRALTFAPLLAKKSSVDGEESRQVKFY